MQAETTSLNPLGLKADKAFQTLSWKTMDLEAACLMVVASVTESFLVGIPFVGDEKSCYYGFQNRFA